MSNWLLQTYHLLPYPLRVLTASLRGYYLRSWRYGPETETLVEEAQARESWNRDRWNAWQEEHLARLLHRAATQVPYYREHWSRRRRQGDYSSWESLENWPVLDKKVLRRTPRAFVADDRNIRNMFHEHTSGTSGTPLSLWWSRNTVRNWYALFEARCRRWHGVSRHDRWAILGGQLVVPPAQTRPPFWVWNQALSQLYLSSYHLSPDLIPYYLEALSRYDIKYLWGYTSSLYALAQVARTQGFDLSLKVALTNAEPVYDYQRQAIAAAFRCPVRETYGMAEIVAAASECPEGQLHLWPEVGIIEILENGLPASPGVRGDLVCTGLLNLDMPLIRYRVGDRGSQVPGESLCSCGRRLPLLAQVEGRVDDILYTADGRQVGRLDPVFKSELPLEEAQIIQESLNRLRVRYVPGPGFSPADGQLIIDRLRERFGHVQVTLEELAEVPRESNGKFRAVICRIPPDELPHQDAF